MGEKPELIVVSQNLLGGGASFHKNMLSNFPRDFFDIKCIYLDPVDWNGARALDVRLNEGDRIFSYKNEPAKTTAAKLSELISNREGAIVTNLETELICLDLHERPAKTIFFICHDAGFMPLAVKYQGIIDVFIAHNISVYNDLIDAVGRNNKDIFFIQHGVAVQPDGRVVGTGSRLKIVFLARHYEFKGIYDLPVIDSLLAEKGVSVDWTILGDGPERNNLIRKVEGRDNFKFHIPPSPAEVLEILKTQDVFILPSRNDGLPVALLEAMSVGCVPLLANFSEGIKAVVTDEVGFVLEAGDNAHFADKIALLSADRNLLQFLSRNAVGKIRNEFDIQKQAMLYFNLYRRYKEFKKHRRSGLADFLRKLNYSENFNKLVHILGSFRNKVIPKGAK